jgi:methyl coenzyme M reductase subunit C-like uncharacterized protein (methanogenesis marker protein 7)
VRNFPEWNSIAPHLLTNIRVIYFNLGSHHVPHSGDIPNTLMHTSASSVMFTPLNFHDRDPSRRSVQGVKLSKGADGTTSQYFGGTYKKGIEINKVSTMFLATRLPISAR